MLSDILCLPIKSKVKLLKHTDACIRAMFKDKCSRELSLSLEAILPCCGLCSARQGRYSFKVHSVHSPSSVGQSNFADSGAVLLAAGLYAWRDSTARAEDESTGYVLSRSLLQKLAMQLPTSASKVRSLCNTRSVNPVIILLTPRPLQHQAGQ